MNDKEIGRIIESCTDKIENTGVDPEEVKSLVMARIEAENKGSRRESEENEELVEPIFVTKAPKSKLGFKIAFTAAAAVCVTAAAVGVYSLRGNISAGSGESVSQPLEESEATASPIETEEGADIVLTEAAVSETENILTVRLLDGTSLVYDTEKNKETVTEQGSTDIIELGVGCLWFIGNGEKINITEEAGGSSYYIYTYTNSGSRTKHMVIVGNTADNPEQCGYVELYRIDGFQGGDWRAYGRSCFAVNLDEPPEGMARSYRQWVYDALDELGLVALDLKTVESGEELEMSRVVYISGSALPIFREIPSEAAQETSIEPLPEDKKLVLEFNVLDNSLVRFAVNNEGEGGYSTYMYHMNLTELFASEDGRIYFIGNGEHEDITDIIGEGGTYIYSYVHPERNTLHYLVAGGVGDSFGYAELFPNAEQGSWTASGINCIDGIDYKPWLYSAIEELDIFVAGLGCGTETFSYLFAAE
ncbi:MAG: hypothetical protein NC394_07325 [Bacteroides sp.]|nr:hypothetical protein [Bacteroides sp.]